MFVVCCCGGFVDSSCVFLCSFYFFCVLEFCLVYVFFFDFCVDECDVFGYVVYDCEVFLYGVYVVLIGFCCWGFGGGRGGGDVVFGEGMELVVGVL